MRESHWPQPTPLKFIAFSTLFTILRKTHSTLASGGLLSCFRLCFGVIMSQVLCEKRKLRIQLFEKDDLVNHGESDRADVVSKKSWLHGHDWYAICAKDIFNISHFHTERLPVGFPVIFDCWFSSDGKYLA